MSVDTSYPRNEFSEIIEADSPYAFYLLQWVDYHKEAKRLRLKMLHDVRLKDGTVHEKCWPNADAWHGPGGRFTDVEVDAIRISREQF